VPEECAATATSSATTSSATTSSAKDRQVRAGKAGNRQVGGEIAELKSEMEGRDRLGVTRLGRAA